MNIRTIKIKNPNGGGKYNLRTITFDMSKGHMGCYYGVTDKGRKVIVCFLEIGDLLTGMVGVREAGISLGEASGAGYPNQYQIIEDSLPGI